MGRGDLTAWVAAVGGGGVSVPAGSATAGDVSLQACPDPGCGLSVVAAEHAPAVPSAHCSGIGGALCQEVGETPQLARVLFGLWTFYEYGGELLRSQEVAEELLHLAQSVRDP